ncbi:MAG TPA: SDR family oxidoreductase [Acidimicrobiales bacterium]|jgi:NAD(P)-dependent dehydrogenase (short-subunit alcohol dehydrogenase family)|nr:SDR family oxidoreductase [Acidimicrobiales bacterium]
MGELEGKVAVITGAASGIGLACATRMVADGATVVAVDIAEDPVRRMAEALGVVAVRADVSRPEDWVPVVEAVRRLGGLDFAYLNAGVTTQQGDITALTDDQYRRIMAVNVDGVVFGARALAPELVARGGGALVATASLAGLVALPADPIYAMTKHAVVGLVRSLALTLADQGITVNAVCPGMVDTPLVDDARDALAAAQFPLIAPGAVVEAVLGCMLGEATGQAVVVQAGREPLPFRFSRPPGPRQAGAEGRVPPGLLAAPTDR